ncbi:unnamed protein product [Rotaria magnacalcarata]|uniref:Uncharacterized protein n=1 Tax=Rotaria magnacalcarata TaxID=392030 RepID=A0A815BZB2_9BILA|nr:unnamed protein product [Rotaria magnacalcarata]CAF4241790.1 unnamed protein product [Rotaria magnacalcarata]
MDQSIQYAQVMSNFDSVYNAAPNLVQRLTIFVPKPSFTTYQNRSVSPSLTSSSTKFNFDSYNPNDYHTRSSNCVSPSTSIIIHHRPVYSPPPSPPSQAISKLRQINDELSHTLATCEVATNRSQLLRPLPLSPHYHVHHHPIPYDPFRSHSSNEHDLSSSSSTESLPIKTKHNARIKYKAHIPRRQTALSNVDQILISTSDAYASHDPMTIDLYPTRDQGFVRKVRDRPDNQSPWPADNSPKRRNSFSAENTHRTPRRSYNAEKPIQPRSRLTNSKEHLRSSSVNPCRRLDSAPSPLRRSTTSFSNTAPAWRPSGSIKRPKFVGSHAPPSRPRAGVKEPLWNPSGAATKTKYIRAFDPTSKPPPTNISEPTGVWRPASKSLSGKHPKYFEPTVKPELVTAIKKEKEPVLQRKKVKTDEVKIPNGNPVLKSRIAKAESKVKSAWEGTTTTTKEPRPPIPRLSKTVTTAKPSKIKLKPAPSKPVVSSENIVPPLEANVDTGRSSLNNIPTKPLFQSTPKNQSMIDDGFADVFDNKSQTSETSRKPDIPHQPPRVEKTPPKPPPTTISGSGTGTKPMMKDEEISHVANADNTRNDDHTPSPDSQINNNSDHDGDELSNHSVQPSPIPPKSAASLPKPNNNDDVSIVDDESITQHNESDHDDNNEKDDQSLLMNQSANDATKPTTDHSKIDETNAPLTTSQIPPKAKTETSSSKNADQNSKQSPTPSKNNDHDLPSNPSPPPEADNIDDFFD